MGPREVADAPPTPLGRKFVRYLVGFGVGTALGLAPYLGVLDVPLFKPLLSLIPNSIQDAAIPLSAALMGVLAVAIQWYSEERFDRKAMQKLFARTLAASMLSFILLFVVHTLTVVRLPVDLDKSISVIVGFSRPMKEPCAESVSDEECVKILTTNPAAISSFWGDRQIRISTLSLTLSYLLFTGLFGTLVGLLVLRESASKPPRRREIPEPS